MPRVGQVSHWEGLSRNAAAFQAGQSTGLLASGTGQGGSITGMSWCDLQREAQEWLTQAAVPS